MCNIAANFTPPTVNTIRCLYACPCERESGRLNIRARDGDKITDSSGIIKHYPLWCVSPLLLISLSSRAGLSHYYNLRGIRNVFPVVSLCVLYEKGILHKGSTLRGNEEMRALRLFHKESPLVPLPLSKASLLMVLHRTHATHTALPTTNLYIYHQFRLLFTLCQLTNHWEFCALRADLRSPLRSTH